MEWLILIDGFINLNKPTEMTSHDAVSIVRRIFGTKKVGHGGTLDPAASGVLPVAVGRATKFLEYIDNDKSYRAEILFGTATDSGDITGEIVDLAKNFSVPTLDELKLTAKNFVGEIEQTPPKFSAIKINGRKAYDLARKKIDFDMPKRTVKIYRMEILKVDSKNVTVEVDCSKGTYIRTLAADFAAKFNLPATLKSLTRIKAGSFCLENAATIDELKSDGEKFIRPIESCLLHLDIFNLPEHRIKAFCNGLPTDVKMPDGILKVYSENKFLGIGAICGGELRAAKLFSAGD